MLEAVDDDLRIGPVTQPFLDRRHQLLGVTQARHGRLADDEQVIRAEQHAVGPGEPGARHVEHDVVEIGRHEIEQARDHIGVERPHLRRTVRRGDHGEAGRMIREHDLEQLPVESVRPRLDLRQVQARLEVEIVGRRTVLEIQIEQTGGGLGARAAAVEHQHCRLHRQCGHPGAADGGQECVDLRLGRSRHSPHDYSGKRERRRAPNRSPRPASPRSRQPASAAGCAPCSRRSSASPQRPAAMPVRAPSAASAPASPRRCRHRGRPPRQWRPRHRAYRRTPRSAPAR